jgi:hypothetical protein
VWHVSISNSRIFKGPNYWPTGTLDRARVMADQELRGVGVGETRIDYGEIAIHFRRRLSDEELRGLSSEWLALPAIDEA